jgi:hypothetical protein
MRTQLARWRTSSTGRALRANRIEESVLLQGSLYPDMFSLARRVRRRISNEHRRPPRRGHPPALPAVDDTSFADAKRRVQTALGFVKGLTASR